MIDNYNKYKYYCKNDHYDKNNDHHGRVLNSIPNYSNPSCQIKFASNNVQNNRVSSYYENDSNYNYNHTTNEKFDRNMIRTEKRPDNRISDHTNNRTVDACVNF